MDHLSRGRCAQDEEVLHSRKADTFALDCLRPRKGLASRGENSLNDRTRNCTSDTSIWTQVAYV